MGLYLKAKDRKEKKIWYDGKEHIWVEGFKGTDENMKCQGFQYKIGVEYEHLGTPRLCASGFHFCALLSDVFSYYHLIPNNRFFKVKALVRKDQWNDGFRDKYVAKKIVFIEELNYEDLKQHINKKYILVKSEEDWNFIKKNGYELFSREYFSNEIKRYDFSETFVNILFDECSNEDDYNDIINLSKAFKEENISKELAVYLMLKRLW